MYANPSVNVISLRTLNDGVMKDIGFDQGAVVSCIWTSRYIGALRMKSDIRAS